VAARDGIDLLRQRFPIEADADEVECISTMEEAEVSASELSCLVHRRSRPRLLTGGCLAGVHELRNTLKGVKLGFSTRTEF
jgi:hypothetical protein